MRWRACPSQSLQSFLVVIVFIPKSPGQTDSQVDASRRKFAEPELAYGLAMGGHTDSQVDSQVTKSRKFQDHAYTVHLQSICVDLRWLAWPNAEKLANSNSSSTKVNVSHRKSSQVGGQTKRKSKTCIDLRRLGSPFGQGLRTTNYLRNLRPFFFSNLILFPILSPKIIFASQKAQDTIDSPVPGILFEYFLSFATKNPSMLCVCG